MPVEIDKQIAELISSQFPEFYQEDGAAFITFMSAYYEWLQSEDEAIYYTRHMLDINDIDNTLDDFIIHFKNTYLSGFPDTNAVGNRFMVKHISDLYKSKGTEESFKLFFRLLFDKDIDVYYPAHDILKASDGIWKEPEYLELTLTDKTKDFIGQQIVGSQSGAKAFVDTLVRRLVSGNLIDIAYISNITGDFITGEFITTVSDNSIDNSPVIIGSLTSIDIINGGANNLVGDMFDVTSPTGVEGKARVTGIEEGTGRVNFNIIDGGSGYTTDAFTHVIVSERDMTLTNIENRSKYNNLVDIENKWGFLQAQPQTDWTLIGSGAADDWKFVTSPWNTTQIEVWEAKGHATESSGFTTESVTVNYETTYRFMVPIYVDSTTDGSIEISASNTTGSGIFLTVDLTTAGLDADSWYVLTGYVLPNSDVSGDNFGGLYKVSDGSLVSGFNSTSFKWFNTSVVDTEFTVSHTLNTNASSIRYIGKPIIQIFDALYTDVYFALNGYNDNANAFTRFHQVSQPTASGSFNTMVPDNGFVEGDYVIGTSSGGTVNEAHGYIRDLSYSNTTAGTITINTINGDFTLADRLEVGANTALPGAGLTDSTVSANTTASDLTDIGTHDTTGGTFSVGYHVINDQDVHADIDVLFTGSGATFSVGSIQGDETLTVYTDLLAANNNSSIPFMQVGLGDLAYGFPNDPSANSETILAEYLSANTMTIGEITSLDKINPGSGYNKDPFVAVINPVIASYNRKEYIDIAIENLSGSFVDGELLEQTITSDDYVLTVTDTTGFDISDGVTQEYANTTIYAQGVVRSVDTGTQLTVLPLNETVFDTAFNVTKASDPNVNTAVSSVGTTQVETFAKGTVQSSNTSMVVAERNSFNTAFDSNFPISGDSSNATADVIGVDAHGRPMGDNAEIDSTVQTASGIVTTVEIIDSGIGYIDQDSVTLIDENKAFTVTGTANLIKQGKAEGYWQNTQGFLNSNKYIHDNNYYQEYSYEIQVDISLDKYVDMFKEIMHISGTALFGSVNITTTADMESVVTDTSLSHYIEATATGEPITVSIGNATVS